VRAIQVTDQGMTDELKAKLGLLQFEKERNEESLQARIIHADSTEALAVLNTILVSDAQELRIIQDSYRDVYAEIQPSSIPTPVFRPESDAAAGAPCCALSACQSPLPRSITAAVIHGGHGCAVRCAACHH